jgi:hypothetical protein
MVMETPKNLQQTAIKYGLITTAGLIGYFLLMKLVGLHQIAELRMLNLIILIAGVWLAIRSYKRKTDDEMDYLQGFGIGMLTSAVSVIIFSVFIFIYLNFLDPAFMETLKQNEAFGQYLNPYMAAVAIFFEGMGSALILSFIIMQYMKGSMLGDMKKKEKLSENEKVYN